MWAFIEIVYDREMGLYHLKIQPKRPDNLTTLESIQYYGMPTVLTLTLNDLTNLKNAVLDAVSK
jgi:hypothetical protein